MSADDGLLLVDGDLLPCADEILDDTTSDADPHAGNPPFCLRTQTVGTLLSTV